MKVKSIILTAISVAILAAPAVFAQDQAEIDKALMAAPGNLKKGATVIKWKADHTYETLKKGTNDLVCYDKSGFPGAQPFFVECTSAENIPRVEQNMKIEAMGDKATVKAAFDKAEADGTRVKPKFGSVWYHQMGPDAEHVRAHMTIAVPDATTASMGLPESGKAGGVWIMNAGTSTAHLMTPGE